ncbi:wbuO protein [Aquiflexum sp. TKW24L]|uniref:wbuO protein n=1 Tax=Aquiflexum sp. TKW24L TaxID=2942212 RepID=UPI0020BE1B62|nr:wbuO protein [Aquiflexum sp. TKW24L]MCL6261248.1 wbuO protein [Aquiflexum sp. TKW24L]
MENDALTIRHETNPNIRIPQKDILYIQHNFYKISGIRYGILVIVVWLIFLFNLLTHLQIYIFLVAVGLGRTAFYFHNLIRSRLNILTYFVLCVVKYFVIPAIFLGRNYGFEPYLIVLLSFPIIRTIEHSVKGKYKLETFKKRLGSLDGFRVKYYGVLLILSLVLVLNYGFSQLLIYSIGYFFIYRVVIFVLLKLGKYSRDSV